MLLFHINSWRLHAAAVATPKPVLVSVYEFGDDLLFGATHPLLIANSIPAWKCKFLNPSCSNVQRRSLSESVAPARQWKWLTNKSRMRRAESSGRGSFVILGHLCHF